ncbi:MAG: Ribose-phosphate pyrophosphokinase [Candidatus Anoxychlamydiales bacterium]|nr:Ribose-phosphate pyrophosphokinase [Candidatus Anoxychlamydiales bacterium]
MKKLILLFLILSGSIFAEHLCFLPKDIDKDSFRLFCGSSNPELAVEVANILGVNINKVDVGRYNDGEIKIRIDENIKGKDVYILQSICSSKKASVNDHLMELFLLVRACKRSSAKSINAVIPYFGYARQDKKTEDRVPIAASDIAMLLECAGVDHIIAIDLHSPQIQGFFHEISIDNLMPSTLFIPYFERKNIKKLVVVAPHAGALSRSKSFIDGFAKYGIETTLSMIVSHREKNGVIDSLYLIGEVKDSDVLIVDDMCDTGESLVKTSQKLKEKGANKIYACLTHPVFSKNAIQRLQKGSFDKLFVTDTIPLKMDVPDNILQISIAPLVAEAINCSIKGDTLSNLFQP